MLNVFLGLLLILTCVFLIILVLLQRGRGGGLTGALGGTSQSAFGAKAGDTFTWITVGATGFWILLCMIIILTVNKRQNFGEGRDDSASMGGDDDTNLLIDSSDNLDDMISIDPDSTNPDPDDPKSTDPDGTDPDGTDPKPKDSETTDPDSDKLDPSDDTTETPGTDAPGSAEPDSGSPKPTTADDTAS
jgi:preprotein translocase subunit SecG